MRNEELRETLSRFELNSERKKRSRLFISSRERNCVYNSHCEGLDTRVSPVVISTN